MVRQFEANYAYDGHGRRIWVGYADGSTKLQVYGLNGKLLNNIAWRASGQPWPVWLKG